MKLIQVIILVFIAALIAHSDPYGIGVQEQDKKKKRAQHTDTIITNVKGEGTVLEIELLKGAAHNHPLFAVWVEDSDGNYIQSLYVARSIASSVFNYGDPSGGSWSTGVVRRPAALPYWAHKRGIVAEDGLYMPSPENPVPDAYSGATPANSCIILTRLDKAGQDEFYVMLELNQPWDWNEYWSNNKYPDDDEYKTSSQPAVVYRGKVNLNDTRKEFPLEVIGHSHYSGKDGSLNTDISTLTSALQIADKIVVRVID